MKTIRYTLLVLLACLSLNSCQDVEDPANTVPTVVTDAVEKYSGDYAYLSGTVSSRAECYFLISTSEDMSDAQKVEVYSHRNEEKGNWTCGRELGDLIPGTTYYVVLCATDGRSEVKGNVVSFTTSAYLSLESVKVDGKDYSGDVLGTYLTDVNQRVNNSHYGNMRTLRNGNNSYELPYNIILSEPTYRVYAYAPYDMKASVETINAIEVWTRGTNNYLYGSCEVTPSNPKANIEMHSALAKLYFTISTDSKESISLGYINLRNANWQSETEALSINGKLDLATGKITPVPVSGHDGILLNMPNTPIYDGVHANAEMLVIPTSFKDGEIEISVSVNNELIRTTLPATTWEAGKTYEIPLKVNVEAKKAKIGDYYYSDGTWSTAYNVSKECIGIVFALSDKAYGNINTSLTESEHGRIVALKDLKYSIWGDQKVYDQSLCFVGFMGNDRGADYCYLPVDGKEKYGGTGHCIPYNYQKWFEMPVGGNSKDYALCDYGGDVWTHNHGGIKGITEVYSYKAGNKTWFVPSIGEMSRLAMAYGYYNKFSEKVGFEGFSDKTYWTSCLKWSNEVGSGAWYYQFISGLFQTDLISVSNHSIRPIASF